MIPSYPSTKNCGRFVVKLSTCVTPRRCFFHKEYYLFVRDWKQESHNLRLLTADDTNNTGTATTNNEDADETTRSSGLHQEQQQQQQKTTKKSSTLFKIIKPFFKLRQKFVLRRTKRNTIHLNQQQ